MNKGVGGIGRQLFVIGLFVALFVAWGGFILIRSGAIPTPGTKYHVTATVPSAALLTPGARVTIAGVEVGRLSGIERASSVGGNAKLKLELTDKRVTPLPDDSRVEIRTRSQVGENYVSITVGHSRAMLPDGGDLGLDDADELVSVDQLLSTLQGKTRDRTEELLQQFGGALTGRGADLNRTIRGLNGFAENFGPVVDTLHRSRGQTAALVDHLGRLMSQIGDRGTAIDTIAEQGQVAARAIAIATSRSSRPCASCPRRWPRCAGPAGLSGTSATTPRPPWRAWPRRCASCARRCATSHRPCAPRCSSCGPSTPRGSRWATPWRRWPCSRSPGTRPEVVDSLRKLTCQLNPMLRYVNPYAKDILQVVYGLGSSSNSYDATGHLIRLVPLVNEQSLFGAPPAVQDSAKGLLASGVLLPQKTISYDAYMKPGAIFKTQASADGKPATPEEQRDEGYKYPHVTADC